MHRHGARHHSNLRSEVAWFLGDRIWILRNKKTQMLESGTQRSGAFSDPRHDLAWYLGGRIRVLHQSRERKCWSLGTTLWGVGGMRKGWGSGGRNWGAGGWGGTGCHMVLDVFSNAIAEARHLRTESKTFKPKKAYERDARQIGFCLLPSGMPVRHPEVQWLQRQQRRGNMKWMRKACVSRVLCKNKNNREQRDQQSTTGNATCVTHTHMVPKAARQRGNVTTRYMCKIMNE
jgi:hypothetical protein